MGYLLISDFVEESRKLDITKKIGFGVYKFIGDHQVCHSVEENRNLTDKD